MKDKTINKIDIDIEKRIIQLEKNIQEMQKCIITKELRIINEHGKTFARLLCWHTDGNPALVLYNENGRNCIVLHISKKHDKIEIILRNDNGDIIFKAPLE